MPTPATSARTAGPASVLGLRVNGRRAGDPRLAAVPAAPYGVLPAGARIVLLYDAGVAPVDARTFANLAGGTSFVSLLLPGGWTPPFLARVDWSRSASPAHGLANDETFGTFVLGGGGLAGRLGLAGQGALLMLGVGTGRPNPGPTPPPAPPATPTGPGAVLTVTPVSSIRLLPLAFPAQFY